MEAPSVPKVLLEDTGRLDDHYEVTKYLGDGGYARVYECIDKETRLPYACKAISKRLGSFEAASVTRELQIMLDLAHEPNVVTLRSLFEDADNVYLVMDLGSEDLFEHMQRHPNGFASEREVANVMRQLMTALRACHSHGIMHWDLKLENVVLIGSNKSDNNDKEGFPEVKLIDFGFSTYVGSDEVLSKPAGTLIYLAPEVLRLSYGRAADVWSAGCIMFALMSGHHPFEVGFPEGLDCDGFTFHRLKTAHKDFENDKFRYPSSQAWDSLSEAGKDLVSKMLTVDPKMRLTIEEFFYHPWTVHHTSDTTSSCIR
jgi:calcium-dependent protein kinase